MENKNTLCHATPRTKLLCELAKPYKTVADIGCDHAYVAIALAKMNKKVIASDVSKGPIEKAAQNIKRFNLSDKIELRFCSGLCGYKPFEAQAFIIAGMGANVIADILESSKSVAKSAEALFLQPMTSGEVLRKYLYENGYIIKDEHLVSEDRRIYSVIEATSGKTDGFCDFDCYVSRATAAKIKNPLYLSYVKKKRDEFLKIFAGLEKSSSKKHLALYYKELANKAQNLILSAEN